MKKFLFLLLVLIGVSTMNLFAQIDTSIPDGAGFGSIGAVVALTLFVTELIKGVATVKGFAAQLLSWGIGIIVSGVGWFLNLGIFENVEFPVFAFYAIAVTLAANGIFKIPVIKKVLDQLFKYLNKNKVNA